MVFKPIYCPVCGNLAYIRLKIAPKEGNILKIGDIEVDIRNLPELPKSIVCPWCRADIPVEDLYEEG
jgi:rubredoxin